MRIRRWALCALAAAALATAASATAQVLDRVRDSGVVRIGYREDAIPFSTSQAGRDPVGYSIDLCRAIVEDLSIALGGKSLRIAYRRVTPVDRIEQVTSGRIDLECGSTTINEERLQRVAFSPVIFFAGTRLLVKRGGAVHSMRDLAGRTVVAVRATTNARAMLALGAGQVRDLRVINADSYDQAIAMVDTGAADALAADDVLIAGVLAERGLADQFIRVGEPITPEPYGIAFARGDAALADVVLTTFARLSASREIRAIYAKWFVGPLPSGGRLGLPMHSELERSFRALGLPPE